MSPRHLISLSGRLVRAAVYVVVAGFILFVALTRTEVGREGLRSEVERRFNRSLAGELEIGYLSGNLLNRLSARDVVVRDSSGRTIIRVDSVVLHPQWRDVFRRSVSVGRAVLVRPEIHLRREDDGSWNAARAFERVLTREGAEPWAFHTTRVEIIDGRLTTASEKIPDAVRLGHVFDWTNAEVTDLQARAIVDWETSLKLVDVLDASARLVEPELQIDSLRGQFVHDGDRLALNEVRLKTHASRVHVNGSISSLAGLRSDPRETVLDLELSPSLLEGAELNRLIPALALREVISVGARIEGPLSRLVVEEVFVERGASRLALEGTVLGLPDSVNFEAALRPGTVRWRDLVSVWPDVPVPSFSHLGPVEVAGSSDGSFVFDAGGGHASLSASSELQLVSTAGRLNGRADVGLDGAGPIEIRGTIEMADFDVGRATNRSGLVTRLNGRIAVEAAGAAVSELEGEAVAALSGSSWDGRRLDTLRVSLNGSPKAFQGDLFARRARGTIQATLAANLGSDQPAYLLEGRTDQLDVGVLLADDSLSSALNTRFTVDGRGRSWTAFEGDVALRFDASSMTYGDAVHAIPSHTTHVVVRQQTGERPRISISGDAVELEVTGDASLRPLVFLSRHWLDAGRRAVHREMAKPYRFAAAVADTSSAAAGADPPLERPEGRTVDLADANRARDVDFRLRILRSDILSALFPTLPAMHADLDVGGALHISRDSIGLHVHLNADSLYTGPVRSHDLAAAFTFSAVDAADPLASMTAEVTGTAADLQIGAQVFTDPRLTSTFVDRGFDVQLTADAPGAAAPFRFVARMDLLEDRNRLVVTELQAAAREEVWTAPGVNIVDFFEEAVFVRGIRIQHAGSDGVASPGFLQLEGTLSNAPDDTLFVRAEEVLMEHLGAMIGLGDDLGGRLDGRLAFTGLTRQPELTGTLRIDPLIFRDRHLGRLLLNSRYVPGSPDVGLHARIEPSSPENWTGQVTENAIEVDGTFRLPAPESSDSGGDPGRLDLSLDVAQADAFFFEHIFREVIDDVSGHLSGSGHVGGDFSRPVFNARLAVHEARFRVPEFGLTFAAAGHVDVDERGIHLDGVDVTDTDDGRAAVRGSILFNEYRYFSFDLHGRLDDLRIMNVPQSRDLPFYGSILASGDVDLTGPLSNALLRSTNARTNPASDLYIPIAESGSTTDAGFIVFADSLGRVPDFRGMSQRPNLLAQRPAGERPFLDGLGIDLNILAPEGSTVHLVIDPLLGDVINAVGGGRIQLVRDEGEFSTFGTFAVTSGDYLFTAGEVFFRRFLIDSGTITWDGDPLNAMLDISASYRTRASTDGLGLGEQQRGLIPLVIELDVSGRVATPIVDLSLSIDRDDRQLLSGHEGLEAVLNQPEHAAQYATSVLLTNSFLLTGTDQGLAQSRGQIAFNSLSQLVASQLNRYINYALPNVNLNLGVQGESTEDIDVTYGVALRLLDERLIIRGQGIYQNDEVRRQQQGMLDEFVVEVRLNPRVSVEVFYRREGDILSTESLNTSTTGAGLSYQTEFTTWRRLIDRLFGWMYTTKESEAGGGGEDEEDDSEDGTVADADN